MSQAASRERMLIAGVAAFNRAAPEVTPANSEELDKALARIQESAPEEATMVSLSLRLSTPEEFIDALRQSRAAR